MRGSSGLECSGHERALGQTGRVGVREKSLLDPTSGLRRSHRAICYTMLVVGCLLFVYAELRTLRSQETCNVDFLE